jgi:hypothetical protein
MTTYERAKQSLERLEEVQVNSLPKSRIPALGNGRCQFFSIENNAPNSAPDVTLPLIVAVGINYDQENIIDRPQAVIPHIYTTSKQMTWVEDYKSPATRASLRVALAQFCKNRDTWHENGYASEYAIKQPFFEIQAELAAAGHQLQTLKASWRFGAESPFIMICANVCPFLSTEGWSSYGETDEGRAMQVEALDMSRPNEHIGALFRQLGTDIDLWMIHGKEHVWPTFEAQGCIRKWIKSPNLSIRTRNLKLFEKFWRNQQVQRRPQPPVWPTWTVDRTELRNFTE